MSPPNQTTLSIPETLVQEGLFFAKPALNRHVSVPKDYLKAAHLWFRWNLAWFIFFCVFFIPLPFWLFPVSCLGGFIASVIVTVWQVVVLLACMVSGSLSMIKLYQARGKDWTLLHPDTQKMVHLVCISGYKEPLDVICSTIDSLKAQTVRQQLVVNVGLEERTPDFDIKKGTLLSLYAGVFRHIMVSQHPFGVPGEVPGKCSNANYALRQGVKELKKLGLYDTDYCVVTTCDTDNPFSPKYFEYLGYDFLRAPSRTEVVWQAPLLYNFDLDKRPFFVRVTGIQRAMFMLGILIPQNITTMSVFSMSATLLEKGFVHPRYQMDDVINIVRRMIAIHKLVKIRIIPYAVISGPTSGSTYSEEVTEWARQARRWTIGAAEVFHYFCVKWSQYDTWSGIVYGFLYTHYYGFVICGMSLFNLSCLIASSIYYGVGYCEPADFLRVDPNFIYFPLIGIIFTYFFFAWSFIMDKLGTQLMQVKEDINIFRNILHWLSAPLVLLAYSFIEFYAIIEVAIFGKSVCHHGASKKEGLVQKF